MSQMLLINPRRRRKAKKARRSHGRKRTRRMTAKQLKYFGPRKRRSHSRRRTRRNPYSTPLVLDNPRRRRRSRRSAGSHRRRYRRNPIGGARISATLGSVQRVVTDSVVGAAGAVGVDVLMGQASKFLPPSLVSKYDPNTGGINWAYLATKAGLAVAVGIVGARFLPGSLKGLAAKAASGSLTVQAYELIRPMAEQYITLGYYNPAQVSRPNLNAYLPRAGARLRGTTVPGVVGSKQNFEGYSL